MKMWKPLGTGLLLAAALGCGGDDDSSTKKNGTGVTAADFAESYRGRSFTEAFDADGNVVNRFDDEEAIMETSVGPDGRVFFGVGGDNIGECSVYIEPTQKGVPEQSCALEDITITTTGTWSLQDGELTLEFVQNFAYPEPEADDSSDEDSSAEADEDTANELLRSIFGDVSEMTFTGTQTTDPRGDDIVVIDDANDDQGPDVERPEPETPTGPTCQTRADCTVDQECVAAACLDHMWCTSRWDDTGWEDDGYTYTYEWQGCDDGKSYAGECVDEGDFLACDCLVNEVVTAEFERMEYGSDEAENVTDPQRAHRTFNKECGWLLPAIY